MLKIQNDTNHFPFAVQGIEACDLALLFLLHGKLIIAHS